MNLGPAGLVIRRAEPNAEPDSIARLTEIGQVGEIPSLHDPGLAAELVSPRARRRGIATALVARALGADRDRGATNVWVETRSDWVAAAAFWRSIGFRAPG